MSGVGPKVAGRITAELKDKVAKMDLGPVAFNAEVSSSAPKPAQANLGYGRADAFGAVAAAARTLGPDATVEALITAGLKELAA